MKAQFLIHEYSDMFVQAGKANKLKFKEALRTFRNTSQQAKLKIPLIKSFGLFNDSSITRSGCNKMLMIITDGQADKVEDIFEQHNHDKSTRVFSFKIGRDMNDLIEMKKLACENNGEFYHVVTLTDINEHVSEYISVLSRPMALMGAHETQWSNLFIGYLDKELKIAVARPAFVKSDSYENALDKSNFEYEIEKQEVNELVVDETMDEAYKVLKRQQALLGVVGIDIPVFKLISRASPKYQMGVGLYLIMLDNNGYVVFHPSIRQEIADGANDFKGTSHSIDLNKFEIPFNNHEEFESLEHDMIDKKTGRRVLMNWKRDGKYVWIYLESFFSNSFYLRLNKIPWIKNDLIQQYVFIIKVSMSKIFGKMVFYIC